VNETEKLIIELKATHDGFVEVRCCDRLVGIANARLFTDAAHDRLRDIMNREGDDWPRNQDARDIIVDPSSYAPPPDGTPLSSICDVCKSGFVWDGGLPTKVHT